MMKYLGNGIDEKQYTVLEFILDGLDVCMEGVSIDTNAMLSVPTNEGHVFIPMKNTSTCIP